MKYLSICSGIEAASVAFEPLGWRPLAFSEIEAFPRAVLKHHYPDTPCHGDFTTLKDETWIVDADMLCGGTPCQAFSVAGNRQSLADDRGNLTLQFVLLADAIDRLRSTAGREPAWILWENVPGVLSTNDNAFGAFLGGLAGNDQAIEPGPRPGSGKSSAFWRWAKNKHVPKWPSAGVVDGPSRCVAWRTLNAEHFGLAQRRKRVFVLARGGAGRWAVADALLPIIESREWHPAPDRKKGEEIAADAGAGAEGCVDAIPINTQLGLRGDTSNTSREGIGMGNPGDPAFTLQAAHGHAVAFAQPPMFIRMREGKEGGGKGPLVSDDMSLTLATGNDQVLAYSPKIDTLQAKGVDHASTYEADASSALSTLLEKVGAEAYAQWGLGILGAFQSPEVLRAWLHGESLRQSTDETRPRLVNGAPSREESVAGEVLRKVWFDGPDGRTSQGRGLAKQLAGKPCEALSVLPHEGAPDETDMQVVRQAREGSRLLRQALSEIEAARRSEQVGVADQAEMHDAGMRPDEPRARAMQQARATTEEGNTGTATANQVTSGDGSLGPQMMVRRLLPAECERLQGFPPGYTNIPWRGKPESPDGPRYKALGNSWAVPCARWIGERIKAIRP